MRTVFECPYRIEIYNGGTFPTMIKIEKPIEFFFIHNKDGEVVSLEKLNN